MSAASEGRCWSWWSRQCPVSLRESRPPLQSVRPETAVAMRYANLSGSNGSAPEHHQVMLHARRVTTTCLVLHQFMSHARRVHVVPPDHRKLGLPMSYVACKAGACRDA
eukprot:365157-Chlamydomonas_euryale.AAC.30